jgi:hypothetical protein
MTRLPAAISGGGDVPDWALLKHAYGEAVDIPDLLAALSPDPEARAWEPLWSRLCHQGTVYSASFAALPVLLAAASGWAPAERVTILCLAASIVSGKTVDCDREGLRTEYQPIRSSLETLAHEALRTPALSDTDFIYMAQAVLAFRGDVLWGDHLDRLNDGEFQGRCRSCGHDLYLAIGEYGFFTTAEEWVKRPDTRRHSIEPADALSDVGGWLQAEALQASRQALASSIRHLFGSTVCPVCGTRLSVEMAIKEWAS